MSGEQSPGRGRHVRLTHQAFTDEDSRGARDGDFRDVSGAEDAALRDQQRPRRRQGGETRRGAEIDVEGLAREPRMTAPTYAGTTDDGAALTLTADEARPAAEGAAAEAQGLQLDLLTPDGASTNLRAATAVMDDTTGEIVLSGGVTVVTSTGYRLETAELAAKLDRSGLESRAPVTATGPAGDISAARVTLRQDNLTPGTYLLVFNGGVRLVYRPGG